ncbi:MAG: nuclear transport factor 2 family protein [Asgard group archaeon]|nr:nuclear transport factor 2 family protein [Asgard group archaeon]
MIFLTDEQELLKVKEAVNYYANGAIKRDFEYLSKGWHKDCQMFGLNPEGKLAIYDLSFWKEGFAKPLDDDPEYKRVSKILNVDIHGIAASAKVETVVESSKGKVIFMDYLNHLKIDGKWWIVNKIFDAIRKPKE